ncbi:MAG: ATPase, partial [Armatimonadetes bacterium]
MEEYYTLTSQETANLLKTDIKLGLSTQEANRRLKENGLNTLKAETGPNIATLFLHQFTNLLIIILLLAAFASFLLGDQIDAIMILTIVFLNTIIGFIQEYRAKEAIKHLKKFLTTSSSVTRDGRLLQIPSSQLIPGDIIHLEEGQKVPSDIRLLSTINLSTVESSLTGESTPITKQAEPLNKNLPLNDQKNMVFSGTIISSGKGTGIVIATGMQTELGKIASLVSQEEDITTPLQIKLARLGKFIAILILGIAVIIAILEIISGRTWVESAMSAISLAVAAIPEGLPAVVTISLALGAKRLLTRKALIRNLPSAETLGSTDFICVDKTGTLTAGKMSVSQIYCNGHFFFPDKNHQLHQEVEKLILTSLLANNAHRDGDNLVGDTTETALIETAEKYQLNHSQTITKYPRVIELPFTSHRKMITVAHQNGKGYFIASKGAPEAILEKTTRIFKNGKIETFSQKEKDEILKTNSRMAGQALRVLAFAYKEES